MTGKEVRLLGTVCFLVGYSKDTTSPVCIRSNPQLVITEYLCRYRLLPSLKSPGKVASQFKICQILSSRPHYLNPAVFYSQVS